MVEYPENCKLHLMFTDGTCLSVFAEDANAVGVVYESEVIQSEDEVEPCDLQSQDFALV